MKRKVTVFLLIALVLTGCSRLTLARGVREVAHYQFGEELVFEASAPNELKEARLFYQISDYNSTEGWRSFVEGECRVEDGGRDRWYCRYAMIARTEAKVIIPLLPGTIAPAAEVRYFWKLEDGQANVWQTEERSFLYLDQRFSWQSWEHGDITLFWYEEGEEFAEAILAQLDQSFAQIDERLGFAQRGPIKIVVYQDLFDMAWAVPSKAAMFYSAIAWGHTFTFRYNSEELEQVLTHELGHLLTHQLVGEDYRNLPFWLSEGLATYVDGGDWEQWVGWLSATYIGAYGEACSQVTFLIEEHGGKEKIHQLLTAIAEGVTVDEALLDTYGFDQERLEEAWLDWLALREATREPTLDVSRSMTGN